MRIPLEINQQVVELPKIPAVFIVSGKMGLWLVFTLVTFYFLFDDITGQISTLVYDKILSLNLTFLLWVVLIVCLAVLWLVKYSI